MQLRRGHWGLTAGLVGLAAVLVRAQEAAAPPPPTAAASAARLAAAPGVTGAEHAVLDAVRALLPAGTTLDVDAMGNGTVTIGTGEPVRLVLCALDERGWRVTQITDDGYCRLSRPGHTAGTDLADALLEGKPVVVQGERGDLLGAVTARSTHLRGTYPPVFDLDQVWVDVGARSADEARAMGVFELAPVAWRRGVRPLAEGRLAGPALGDRVGAGVCCAALARLDRAAVSGTLVFAFAAQRWHLGSQRVGRGPEALAARWRPQALCGVAAAVDAPLGAGVVIPEALHAVWAPTLGADLAGRCRPGAMEDPGLGAFRGGGPATVRAIGVPVRYRHTAVEQIDAADTATATAVLLRWCAETGK